MSRDDDWSWRGSNRTSSLTPRSQKLKPSRHYSNNNNTTQVVTCNQPKNRSVGASGNAVSFPSHRTFGHMSSRNRKTPITKQRRTREQTLPVSDLISISNLSLGRSIAQGNTIGLGTSKIRLHR
jgi:hypothetical protein